jgi:predicted DCC family thiol-disulfide oxidoreductase YuxK
LSGFPAADRHEIVLFDGVCNFCEASVNFIIKHDRKARFRFAPLQSEVGAEIQRRYNLDPSALDTLVLVERGKLYTKSTAALRVARRLSGVYPLFYAMIVVPPFVRDFLYDWFARRRYRWFGRKDECMAPTADMRERFLDS